MFKEIQNCTELVQLTRRMSYTGLPYLVLAQQAGHWQHRLVIQLRGEPVRAFSRAVHGTACGLLLGNAGGPDTMYAALPGELRSLMPPPKAIAPALGNPRWALRNCMDVVGQMLHPPAVAEAGMPQVRDICVSVVLPAELYEAAESLADRMLRNDSD
jgi:hypothetical protein